jgi:hypothetical protein
VKSAGFCRKWPKTRALSSDLFLLGRSGVNHDDSTGFIESEGAGSAMKKM